jgi:hypothetical protein
MPTRFVIEDVTHGEDLGEFADLASARAELHDRANIPLDQEPDRAPCTSWRTCGRSFDIVEVAGRGSEARTLRRAHALEINARGVRWNAVGGDEVLWEPT